MADETPAMYQQAVMTLAAEADLQDDDVQPPVIPPGRMADFQREWRNRPTLRCLIRAASRMKNIDQARRRNRQLQALYEMAQSHEWRRESGGRLPFAEFFTLAGLGADGRW